MPLIEMQIRTLMNNNLAFSIKIYNKDAFRCNSPTCSNLFYGWTHLWYEMMNIQIGQSVS